MNSHYTIRRVNLTLAEAGDLLAVERRSLADSPYTPVEILQVLQQPQHYTYVACLDNTLVGFCSCLETPSDEGPRLEIDLLGVLPEHRGYGLATRLIACSIEEASRRGIRLFRAIVAVPNHASQRAFQRAGLVSSPVPCDLLIYVLQGNHPVSFLPAGWEWRVGRLGGVLRYTLQAPQPAFPNPSPVVSLAECLEVYTLSYRGLWLEKLWAVSPEAERLMARVIVEHAKVLDLDEVGYLAPQAGTGAQLEAGDNSPFLREGYQNAGSYLRFVRRV